MNQDTKHLGLDAQGLRAEMRQYYGGHDQNYKSQFGPMQYTPGVRFFFVQGGNAGAYWLRDILTTQPEVTRAWQKHGFICVLLERAEDSSKATLTVCEDLNTVDLGNGKTKKVPLGETYYKRELDYSDVQPGQWLFYIEGGLMMLPNER